MSRGLGKLQIAFLEALQAAESETGPGFYKLDYIATRAYRQSSHLAEQEQARQAALSAWQIELTEQARAGNRDAERLLLLRNSIIGASRKRGGWYRSSLPTSVDLNPSRVVRLLENRGLVQRRPGYVSLTNAGRDAISVPAHQAPRLAEL